MEKIVNISDIEDICTAKLEIESYLLANKKIEKKLSLDEFLKEYLNITNNIYLYKDIVIPFNILNINNIKYIVVGNNDNTNILLDKLNSIDYDLSVLKQYKNENIISDFQNEDYNIDMFMINKKLYTI